MEKGKFTLETFQKTMHQIKRMGPMKQIMKMIPGMGDMMGAMDDMNPEEDLKRIDGIINSMTPEERKNPEAIDRSRRARIAMGSGVDPADVNKMLKDFKGMSGMMSAVAGERNPLKRFKRVQDLAKGGMLDPNAQMKKEKQRSKRGPQDTTKLREDKKKKRKEAKKKRKKNRK